MSDTQVTIAVPAVLPGHGSDHEDAGESVYRLAAVADTIGVDNTIMLDSRMHVRPFTDVLAVAGISGSVTARDLVSQLIASPVDINTLVDYGPLADYLTSGDRKVGLIGGRPYGGTQPVFNPRPNPVSEQYVVDPTFRAWAGRHIEVINPIADEDDYQAKVTESVMRLTGQGTDVIVKTIGPKAPLLRISADESQEHRRNALSNWLFDNTVHGLLPVMVSEQIDMTCEYRTFIDLAEGELLTGAGCVEYFTPQDNTGELFDNRLETVRGSRVVHRAPQLVNRILDTAQQVARELQVAYHTVKDDPAVERTLCVDFAVNASNNQVVVVEYNQMSSSGLYATDPSKALRITAADMVGRLNSTTDDTVAFRPFQIPSDATPMS